MGQINENKILAGKPEGKSLFGRPRRRWKDNMLLTEHHVMKTYWRSGGIAPRILDPGTKWR
jgi:hypothetical protein